MAKFGKWTSVEKKLPKKTGNYIIFGTYYFTPDHVGDIDHYDDIGTAYYDVTYGWISLPCEKVKYWMKTPKYPIEGGDDNG